MYSGMYEEALNALPAVKDRFHIWRGIIYARMGEIDLARQLLDEYCSSFNPKDISSVYLAILYFTLGRDVEGFKILEDAYDNHNLGLNTIKTYPELDIFKSDPRLIDLLERLGLADN